MSFYLDMCKDARKWLKFHGHIDSGSLDDRDSAIWLYRMMHRVPRAHPRSYESSQRITSVISIDEKKGLVLLKNEVESGESLIPRMSTSLVKIFNDHLLNDWGIHHFHLGTKFENSGFISRTKHVVFAIITQDKFLLIDIKPHNPAPWSDPELLKIIYEVWPEVLQPHYLPGVKSRVDLSKPEHISRLRKAGITTMTSIGGKVFTLLGGGLVSDGGSVQALVNHDRMANFTTRLQHEWYAEVRRPASFRLLDEFHYMIQEKDGRLWTWEDRGLIKPLFRELLLQEEMIVQLHLSRIDG